MPVARQSPSTLACLALALAAAWAHGPVTADAAQQATPPASRPASSAPPAAPATRADARDVPPVLIPWPLTPPTRGEAASPPPAVPPPATAPSPASPPPAPVPAAAPAPATAGARPALPLADDEPLVPLLQESPEDPGMRLAAMRPGAGLPGPSLEPSQEDRTTRPPAGRPPTRPPASPAEPAPAGQGQAAREPAPAAPAASAGQPPIAASGSITRKPAGPAPGSLSDTEIGLLMPDLSLPTVGARVAVADLTPPTVEVRRWQLADVDGVTWESEEALQDGEWIVLRGKVDVQSGVERIRADEMRLNVQAQKLEADGNVVLDRSDARLTGRRLEYDLGTNTGVMLDAMGFTGDDLSFTSDIAEKVGENKYVLRGATFTSCTQPAPIWQVKATKSVVEIDKFVYLWNPRVFFRRVPLSWMPWVAFPIKQHRATGFMVPRVSSSSRRGTSVSEEFFWAINRSVDMTVGGTWWAKYGFRVDGQARWFLNGMNEYGFIEGIFLRANKGKEDPRLEPERYLVNWEHRQSLGEWDLTVTGEIATDPLVDEFDGLLSNDTTTSGLVDRSPILNQRLTMQRRWGKHSLNLLAENDERGQVISPPAVSGPIPPLPTPDLPLDGTRNNINTSLPVAEYRASGLQLGGKKWVTLSMEGSLASLTRAVEEEYKYPFMDPATSQPVVLKFDERLTDHQYTRADFYPQLQFPLGTTFLRVIPTVNVRGTWWSRIETDADPSTPLTLDQATETVDLPDPATGDSITVRRTLGEDTSTFMWAWDAGVRIEGPDFERIFRPGAEPGQRKWQHVVEPSLEYSFAPELDNVFLIAGDQRRSHYQQRFPTASTTAPGGVREGGLNEVRLRLVNTLRNKRVVPAGSTPEQPRDLVIWSLSSTWDVDKVEADARFQRPRHEAPEDCNGDGDTLDPGEAAGERCADRTEETRFTNIQSDFNIRPTDRIRFSLRNTYDVLADDLTQTSLVGGVDGDWGYVDVALSSSRDRDTLDATNTEVSVTGEQWLYRGGRVRLGYDLTRKLDEPASSSTVPQPDWIYKRFIVSYYNQCIGLSLSWEDNAHRSIQREKEWTFIVSLKELGNFLRYRRRTSN